MSNIDTVIDTDTITTDAGDYVVSWFYDEDSESPLPVDDDSIALYIHGGDRSLIYDTLHQPWTPASEALSQLLSEHYHDREAVTRRYEKWRAITGSPWQLFTGSGNGNVQGHWWNWYLLIDTTAGFVDVAKAAQSIMDEYELWASGDVVGYVITGPDGDEIPDGSCWGFIGDHGRKHAMEDQVRPVIDYDVEQRQKNASLVGAGFVGLI